MSINKTIKVEGTRGQVVADKVHRSIGETDVDNIPSIDKSAGNDAENQVSADTADVELPNVDGPQQDSQETDEIYVDPRTQAGLPPAGENVADLKAGEVKKDGK